MRNSHKVRRQANRQRTIRRRRLTGSTSRAARVEALEPRQLLTANLNLNPTTGLLTYTATAVDNDLQITTDGANVTFSDPAEPINAIGGLAGLDTNADQNIVTFDATSLFGPFNEIEVNTNGGDDTLSIDFVGANPIPSGGLAYNGGTAATSTGD